MFSFVQGPNHDYRSDLWSAGVFLFCILTGLMPFEGETNQEMKQAVLSQPIDFEEDPWPFVADEAKDLCQRYAFGSLTHHVLTFHISPLPS